jgi:DNA-binding MarR family transcriptional regulator
MPLSKTQQALQWLQQNPGATPYAAAKQFNLSPSTVTRALKVAESTEHKRCPTCGQLIRK